jgi:hypothetical protein
MRDQKMNMAFKKMHKSARVSGHTPIWQRCFLASGFAGDGL